MMNGVVLESLGSSGGQAVMSGIGKIVQLIAGIKGKSVADLNLV